MSNERDIIVKNTHIGDYIQKGIIHYDNRIYEFNSSYIACNEFIMIDSSIKDGDDTVAVISHNLVRIKQIDENTYSIEDVDNNKCKCYKCNPDYVVKM